jgi:hypothetical protein
MDEHVTLAPGIAGPLVEHVSEDLSEKTVEATVVPLRVAPGVPETPTARELHGIRAALARRVDDCWDRLEDAVSELAALHGAPPDDIVDRVRQTIALEQT